jgi:hypothetical protein
MFAEWREFRVDVSPGAGRLVADITDLSAIKAAPSILWSARYRASLSSPVKKALEEDASLPIRVPL